MLRIIDKDTSWSEQVHDLVLDFAVAQHADGELCRQHRRVVDAFRGARPGDAFGRRKFEKTSHDDPMSTYVCNEVGHHVAEALKLGPASDELAVSWLSDTPQDAITVAVGRATGVDKLTSFAERAESSADWWLAALYYSVLQAVIRDTVGIVASIDACSKALDAIEEMLSDGGILRNVEADDVDEVVLQQLSCATTTGRLDLKPRDELLQRIKTSETRKRYPAESHVIFQGIPLSLFVVGRIVEATATLYEPLVALVQASRTHPDSETRYKSLQAAYNYIPWWGTMPLVSDFSWDTFCGERGCTVIQAAREYDFDRGEYSSAFVFM